MTPLYGFLEGDVIGLLILAEETDTMSELARKLTQSARLRVSFEDHTSSVVVQGQAIPSKVTVKQAGLTALDRFDVRRGTR
jgi:hypothetical protein